MTDCLYLQDPELNFEAMFNPELPPAVLGKQQKTEPTKVRNDALLTFFAEFSLTFALTFPSLSLSFCSGFCPHFWLRSA